MKTALKHIPIVLLTLIIGGITSLSLNAQEVSTPTIGAVGDRQKFCLTENEFDLTVQIKLNGYEGDIERFEIKWGDDTPPQPVPFNEDSLIQVHTYDFEDFFGTCIAEKELTVRLDAYIMGQDRPLNSAFFPLFLNPPKAQFSFSRNPICVGETASFINESCPESNVQVVSWSYGDGTTSDESSNTYNRADAYEVTLTVTNECDEIDTITKTLNVIDTAIAVIEVDGNIQNISDNYYVICLGEGGLVYLDGNNSENETSYEWSDTQNGFVRISSGRIARDTLIFTEDGIYNINLTVDNACEIPNTTEITFEVIEAEVPSIINQIDACDELEYTPMPYSENLTYTINGIVYDNFPVTLSPDEYIVEANIINDCNPLPARDTFRVIDQQIINILTPDTTLCSAAQVLPIELSSNDALGICMANGIPLDDCIFDPSRTTEETHIITYEGDCLTSNAITINVIQTDALMIDAPETICIESEAINITSNLSGGIFTGRGIIDDSIGTYQPRQAEVGLDTIVYNFEFATETGEFCPANATIFIEILPNIMADFEVVECEGNTVYFNTIDAPANTSIQYEFGDGDSSIDNFLPSHTYTSADTYTVRMTLSQEGGCEFSVERDIVIEAPPVANFLVNQGTSNCSPLTVGFTQLSTGDNLIYEWDFGNGEISELPNPEPQIFTATGQDTTYTISLTVRNGCSTSVITESVFVKAAPKPFFEIDKNLHCSGETVVFNSIIGQEQSDFISWDFGDGRTLSNAIPDSIVYETNTLDTFLITLRIGNACDTTSYTQEAIVIPSDVRAKIKMEETISCSGSDFTFINISGVPNTEFFFEDGSSFRGDTIVRSFQTNIDSLFSVRVRAIGCGYHDSLFTFRIVPSPTLSLDIPDVVCSLQEFNINTNSNAGGISVNFGNGDIISQYVTTYAYEESGTYPITVIATSQGVLECQQIITDSIIVLASPMLEGIEIGAMPICEGSPIILRDTSLGVITNRQWILGDGNLQEAEAEIQHTYLADSTYTITLIVENVETCTDTINQTLTVQNLPNFDVDYRLVDSCNTRVEFINRSNASSFEWNFGDNEGSNETTPIHRYETSGFYNTTLIASLNGCLDSTMLTVDIPDIPILGLGYVQDQRCPPSNLSLNLTNSSFITDYKIEYGEGTTSFTPNQIHTYQVPGTYEVTIYGSNNICTIDTSFAIEVGDTLIANIAELQNVTCYGTMTGMAVVDVLSGNPPYSFSWSNGLTTNTSSSLVAGGYQITIVDSFSCSFLLNTNIEQPDIPLSNVIIQNLPVSCYEAEDGYLEIAGLGGTPPYAYRWGDNENQRLRNNLGAGNYPLTITDANGCEIETTISLSQPSPLQIDFTKEDICFNQTGNFIVDVQGGTPPYLISRSPNFEQVGDLYEDLPAGRYDIFVEDSNGCPKEGIVEIIERPDWDVLIESNRQSILKGDSVILEAILSISETELEWTPSVNSLSERTVSAQPLNTTNYLLTASDEFGCVKNSDITITVKDTVSVYIPNAFTPASRIAGDGINDTFTAYSHFPAVEEIKSFIISNRAGQILYRIENVPLNENRYGWDGAFQGEPQTAGEYAYSFVIKYIDGEQTFKGIVRLIR